MCYVLNYQQFAGEGYEIRVYRRREIDRGYYTAARRYEFYFRVHGQNNILRTSAASE